MSHPIIPVTRDFFEHEGARDQWEQVPLVISPIKNKPVKEIFRLKCTQDVYDSIVMILEHRLTITINARVRWDISRCPTFATFLERITKQSIEGITLYRKIVSPIKFNEFMNTFLAVYITAREEYESESKSSSTKCGELRIFSEV